MKKIQFTFNVQPQDCDTLLIGVDTSGKLATQNPALDLSTLAASVAQMMTDQDFDGKVGKLFLAKHIAGFTRVLFIGLGEKGQLSAKQWIEGITQAAKTLLNTGTTKLYIALDCDVANTDENWASSQVALIFQKSLYQYQHPSRGEFSRLNSSLESVNFASSSAALQSAIQQAQAAAIGMSLTQDVANMPANFCTPTHLANTAEELAKTYGFEVNILDREQMIAMGMGSFMAVAQGSEEPPKMICLQYKGAASDQAPIALVGKGVTFDTGGISLKPGESMDEMKYDMGGAATVLGVFKALGELKPAINVVGVIPSTENMPSGNAVKPGDVVTSLSGQTIEILNTDAEGRLILCDALTYAQQTFKPAKVIDIATLTGACIIALGHHVSGLMGNDQSLVNALLASGNKTYDRFWQLPLGEEWDEQLKSNFADMANIGGRPGGSITAAQFLARFARDVSWAHLDIAGTAWKSGADKGATGRPVAALVDFLCSQANAD